MPLVQPSTYQSSFLFQHYHLNTIFPSVFRKVLGIKYIRETMDTPDDDFIDLDFSTVGSRKIAIVIHGLEGDASRHYVKGMVRQFNRQGWDAVGMNFRSCSGRPNRQKRSYHMGASDDLALVVSHLVNKGYESIVPIGFSLGGNVTLKYLGENGTKLPTEVKAGVAFSVPIEIISANQEINHPRNRIYLNRFITSLTEKVVAKAKFYPELNDLMPATPPQNFAEFDSIFTGPIHGYKDAMDYWTHTSSIQFLDKICRPTLLVNALDDSFLSKECYPYDLAKRSKYFYLETPKHGGHVGFASFSRQFWSERRAWEFVNQNT